MDEEILRKKYTGEDYFVAVSTGTTSRSGGLIVSPFWDDILENAWLKLNDFNRVNFFVVQIKSFTKSIDYSENFTETSLEVFLGSYKFLEEMEEDSDEYWDYMDEIETLKKVKEHCYEVLGKDYFED